MTTITGNSAQARSRTIGVSTDGFDSVIGLDDDRGRISSAPASDPRTIEDLLDATPSVPRASLTTVAAVFLLIALAQVGILVLAIVNYDIATVRLLLGFVLALPSVLYAFVAAWDHRQLVASGETSPAAWEWAVIFPPAYLALRFARARSSRHPIGAALGWAVAQLVVTVSFAAFAVTAVVLAPLPSAEATATLPAAGVTGSYVVQQVEAAWAADGAIGSAQCPDPEAQLAGTAIVCTAVYDGTPLSFTAVVGDIAAGDAPVSITRWSETAAG